MKGIALILAAYLLLGSLFPGNDFSQLMRIQELYDHYQEHLSSSDASLLSFLCEHFIHPERHSTDHKEPHHELPLMSLSASSFFLLPQDFAVSAPAEDPPLALLPEYAFSHTIPFLSPLLQPPALV